MLRSLALPPRAAGKVYLSAMPGYQGDFTAERDAIVDAGTNTVLCLASLTEIEDKSPRYAEAIKAHLLPWRQHMLPMPDFGAAADRDAWLAEIHAVAEQVAAGDTLLIHCRAGIGRTGTAAACLLMSLGVSRDDARQAVIEAGSQPEADTQSGLIDWVAKVLRKE